MRAFLFPSVCAFLILLQPGATRAQGAAAESVRHRFEIDKIEFDGNATLSESALKAVLLLRETPGGFSQFLERTLGEKFGSKPEYFDLSLFEADIVRLKDLYRERGFYGAEVIGTYTLDSSRSRAGIQYRIQESIRSSIDSVNYTGLTTLPADVAELIFREPMLERRMPYESGRATAEVARVLGILVDHGYPAARFDAANSTAVRHLSTNNFVLTYAFHCGVRRHFGDINLHVEPPRDDLMPNIALRQLDFVPGDVYSREKKISSERNLNRTGLYERAIIDNPAISDSDTTPAVPMNIMLHARPRNELSPEVLVSDENNAFNLGIGLGYTNRNFLGDGRSLSSHLRARTQSIGDLFGGRGLRDSAVIGAVEFDVQMVQPYFFTKALSASWTAAISIEKQSIYILSIYRNRIGLSDRFAAYTFGFFDWTLERVNPEFLRDTTNQTGGSSLLRAEDQPQFNSILTMTLQRDKTNDIFSPTSGFFHSLTLEESGVLPKLIHQSLPFTQYYKATVLGRWYVDLTNTRYNILALRSKLGYQEKYGESRSNGVSIPLNRRFYAGGSGSVRGWRARELGVMADDILQFGGNFILEGNAELRVNHFRGLGKMLFLKLENIWAAYFVDVGNVWSSISDVKPRDIAIGAGFGIRYETFFGPFRIDYGFRLYDPKAESGHQSVFQKRWFADTFGNGVFHFGLGHAF